jgi:predicted phosphodiesterase
MRTLAIGDLHLSSHTPAAVERDAAALVAASPGTRIVFVGDLFDLSAETPRVASERAIEEGFAKSPLLRRAFAEHLERGGELRFVAGNHDPELGSDGARARIAAALGVAPALQSQIGTTPWFWREGALHVEHGHLYDPDNAPAHPLVAPRGALGVHFVEEFIAPTGAFAYLNANDGTPLETFLSAFKLYGLRGPYVVYRYFHAAALALLKSGPGFPGIEERSRGEALLDAFLTEANADRELAAALLAIGAEPTMASLRTTVARLYLDRVGGTIAVTSGLGLAATGRLRAGAALAGIGALALATSWSLGHDRYGGHVHARLSDAAQKLADATDAKLVVFGHAHVAGEHATYANTGSFAFPRGEPGRPYVEITGSPSHPRAERRFFHGSAAKP